MHLHYLHGHLIQIQHLLKLNAVKPNLATVSAIIQIQHLLKLNKK